VRVNTFVSVTCVHVLLNTSIIQPYVHIGTGGPALDAPLDFKAPAKANFQFPVPPINALEVFRIKVSAASW
jgi:hypothetical protein